jgi:hypothetical protein
MAQVRENDVVKAPAFATRTALGVRADTSLRTKLGPPGGFRDQHGKTLEILLGGRTILAGCTQLGETSEAPDD